MKSPSPVRTGIALSLTVLVSYTVCTALYALWPRQGIDFLNALFHGLDFAKLESPLPFTFSMYLVSLAALVVWGFAVGTLFAWLRNLMGGSERRASTPLAAIRQSRPALNV